MTSAVSPPARSSGNKRELATVYFPFGARKMTNVEIRMTAETRNPNDKTGIVHIALGERSYDIAIVTGELPAFAERLTGWLASRGFRESSGHAVFIVTDGHVCHQHAAAVGASLHL